MVMPLLRVVAVCALGYALAVFALVGCEGGGVLYQDTTTQDEADAAEQEAALTIDSLTVEEGELVVRWGTDNPPALVTLDITGDISPHLYRRYTIPASYRQFRIGMPAALDQSKIVVRLRAYLPNGRLLQSTRSLSTGRPSPSDRLYDATTDTEATTDIQKDGQWWRWHPRSKDAEATTDIQKDGQWRRWHRRSKDAEATTDTEATTDAQKDGQWRQWHPRSKDKDTKKEATPDLQQKR